MAMNQQSFGQNDLNRPTLRDRIRARREAEIEAASDPRVIAAPTATPLQATRIVRIRIDTLKVDRSYQREFDQKKIDRIAKDFDPRLFSVPRVNRRATGEMYVINGQHRVFGAIGAGLGEEEAWVELDEGLTYSEEAELYFKLNTWVKPLNKREVFKAAVQAGDLEALSIKAIVDGAGFRVDDADHNQIRGNIVGIGALEHVYRQLRRGTLEQVLKLIADTWGTRVGPSSTLIRHMARFILEYDGVVNRERFVSKLSAHNIDDLVKAASEQARRAGRKPYHEWNMMIVDRYNESLKDHSRRIPNVFELTAMREAEKRASNG